MTVLASQSLQLFIAGGTIDKRYNPLNGELVFSESAITEMLQQGRSTVAIDVSTLMMKDSLEMSDDDRRTISEQCLACQHERIVVTHGTDTMVETAAVVAADLNASGQHKTVVLVGAMVPFQFKESDALFNLGAAITAVQLLPSGVYLTMNGQVFDYDHVVKDRSRGLFQSAE